MSRSTVVVTREAEEAESRVGDVNENYVAGRRGNPPTCGSTCKYQELN